MAAKPKPKSKAKGRDTRGVQGDPSSGGWRCPGARRRHRAALPARAAARRHAGARLTRGARPVWRARVLGLRVDLVRAGKAGKKRFVVLKPERMSRAAVGWVKEHAWSLVLMFDAHPDGGSSNQTPNEEDSKTQIKLTWGSLSCPPKLTRGPILNLARRLHCRVSPLSVVELAMG